MRLTSRKKEILSYFEPVNRDWVTSEIGAPPFDVSCVTWLFTGRTHLKSGIIWSLRAVPLKQWLEMGCWKSPPATNNAITESTAVVKMECGVRCPAMVCPVSAL